MKGSVGDTYGAGLETIDQWIARLTSMPEMIAAGAEATAAFLANALKESVSQKKSPDGKPWKPFKAGSGGLAGAAGAITSKAQGNVAQVILDGVNVYHHYGTHRNPRRQMLPSGGLPDRLGNAIRLGMVDMGIEWMTRKGRHDKGFGNAKGFAKPGMKT